jgi:FSR family fosmidomycin resistance protein-like MFS transporter
VHLDGIPQRHSEPSNSLPFTMEMGLRHSPMTTAPSPSTTMDAPAPVPAAATAAFRILAAVSVCHMLNDMMQSLLPSIYPILKSSFRLNFGQVGLLTFTYQVVASLLQPFIGLYTDRRPMPYALAYGMCLTLAGIVMLAIAPTFGLLLVAAAITGAGSAIFHPESSRIARIASGGQHGFAQSFFQVGGNTGSAIGPLLAVFIVLPRGQRGVAWFSLAAIAGIFILYRVGKWRSHHLSRATPTHVQVEPRHHLPRRTVIVALCILAALVFSKYFYLASLTSYYTFYLISRFGVSVRSAQLHLFVFLGSAAAGTFFGGPIGDRIGPKYVIWGSILGVLPFTLLLPHANLFWTGILSAIIGFVIASAFSAVVVYAQELMPGRVGLVSGIFFGLAFGMGGIGAAVLGHIADMTSISFVYRVCAWLPAIGLLTGFLPNLDRQRS